MAQIPKLDNAPINISPFRDQSRKELVNILNTIRGKKTLYLDPKLSGSLALILQTSLLKEHGVENLGHLSTNPIQSDCKNVLYLVRPQINLMKLISAQIQQDVRQNYQREYTVIFVPRRTVVCEKILQEEKVHSMVKIVEYPLYLIPVDEDVLSFELELAYKECQVDGDTSSLWHVAKAIHKLQSAFGVIPNVRVKGKAATIVADILSRMQLEQPVVSSNAGIPEIDTLILLDRHVDMVTPMCSQLTYEGLLDEFLHINNGAIELDASIMGAQEEGKKAKVPLNSSDKLYREIRDLNFGVVGQVLRQKATTMRQDYTEVTTTSQTVSELKDFVKKLSSLPEMTRHTHLAQHLSTFTTKPTFLGQLSIEQTLVEGQSYDICFEYIEEMIHKQEPFLSVLRLLVLFSITNGGLPKKHFDYLRRELLHSYGFEHMATLINLEKSGLFKKQDSKSNWVTVKRGLNLVVEDVDDANPNDIAYVFSGYAPLSIRLVQHALRAGWRSIEEIVRLLPGPHSERKQSQEEAPASNDIGVVDGRRLLVLVVFIGGVTFAEISALRFLSAQEGMTYDLIIGTTKIINGSSLLETLIDVLP
ncbi:vacuolar protein-sorting-associated protein 33 homolog isoform X2 [Cryptomeria japonica]|uniref:vacuolar protein-sorting-associated protein 33 homolog isoform X2 n=1 Tax=Cryptomeria japonica TaxID=3369 RepID=UPI0025ACC1F8|nr:vacuolar protein-sorting-associated protein 33 homolog isoform X2 [Cryptomeria japonica]